MKKSKITILALAAALCLSGCIDNTPAAQGGESSAFSEQNDSSEARGGAPESAVVYNEFRILEDAISDLGLTVEQLTEKRGELKTSTYKGTQFENGIGLYGWKTTKSDSYTVGGCNIIDGLNPSKLFSGMAYPVSLDILSDRYGFEPINIDREKGMDDCYWALFSHPMYENVSFVFACKEYGFIEEDTSCALWLDGDSADAKPVTPHNPSGSQPDGAPASKTPLSFTEEDRELQATLGELVTNGTEVVHWFAGLRIQGKGNGELHKFKIIGTNSDYGYCYYPIPDNYTERSLIVPTTYSQLENTIKKYFADDVAARLLARCDRGVKTQTGEVKTANDAITFAPIFLEVDGRLYRSEANASLGLLVDYETARVTEKTDTAVQFTYLKEPYDCNQSIEYQKCEELYPKYASKGYIVCEDGEWKLTESVCNNVF